MIEIRGIRPTPEGSRPFSVGPITWVGRGLSLIPWALAGALIIVAAHLTGDRSLTFFLVMTALAGAVLWSLARFLFRTLAARAWKRSPTWPLPNTWTLDDAGFTIFDGAFHLRMSWGAVIAIREEPDRFLFITSPVSAQVLPIRFLDAGRDQITEVRALIADVTASGRLGRGVD